MYKPNRSTNTAERASLCVEPWKRQIFSCSFGYIVIFVLFFLLLGFHDICMQRRNWGDRWCHGPPPIPKKKNLGCIFFLFFIPVPPPPPPPPFFFSLLWSPHSPTWFRPCMHGPLYVEAKPNILLVKSSQSKNENVFNCMVYFCHLRVPLPI
jgi:hypothetical protein